MLRHALTSTFDAGSPLPVNGYRRTVPDHDAAEHAARAMLTAMGLNVTDGPLKNTPKRLVSLYEELLVPHEFEATVFSNSDDYSELVLARDIPFRSLCEHHLLPFYGVAHVGYVPGEYLLGLSKLARVVEACSRGFQIQERMTTQIGSWLHEHLAPRGVGVLVEGIHTCMTARGIRSVGVSTTTMAFYGSLREHAEDRREFLTLVATRVPHDGPPRAMDGESC
jgi:GTP cyclohydrolase I